MRRRKIAPVMIVLMCFGGAATQPSTADPKFTLELRVMGDSDLPCQAYLITNADSSPLTVKRVVYNGEFDAKRGQPTGLDGHYIENDPKGFPAVLTIGDVAYAVRTLPGNFGVHRADYPKRIIFIDVYTSRGMFRFDAAGNLRRAP